MLFRHFFFALRHYGHVITSFSRCFRFIAADAVAAAADYYAMPYDAAAFAMRRHAGAARRQLRDAAAYAPLPPH